MKQTGKVEKTDSKSGKKIKGIMKSSSRLRNVHKDEDFTTIDNEYQEEPKSLTKKPHKGRKKLKSKGKNKVLGSDEGVRESPTKEHHLSEEKGGVLEKNLNEHEDGSSESGTDEQKKSTKKRKNPYTVFVGNLSYMASPEEIKQHFEKAGKVKEVRIPKDRKTNKKRGFAYVQLRDRSSYEKALALHHTYIHGRQINVEYTTQGKKGGPKEEKIKQKNLKLRALSKIGILPSIPGMNKKQRGKSTTTVETEGSETKQQTTEKRIKSKKLKLKKNVLNK